MLDSQCAGKQCGTACIEPLWSSVCSIVPDADSCTLAKLKRVLWVRILYIIYCRWWRRAACFLPKHQSLAFCSLANQSQRLGLVQAQSWLKAAGWETKASLIQSPSSAAGHRRRRAADLRQRGGESFVKMMISILSQHVTALQLTPHQSSSNEKVSILASKDANLRTSRRASEAGPCPAVLLPTRISTVSEGNAEFASCCRLSACFCAFLRNRAQCTVCCVLCAVPSRIVYMVLNPRRAERKKWAGFDWLLLCVSWSHLNTNTTQLQNILMDSHVVAVNPPSHLFLPLWKRAFFPPFSSFSTIGCQFF